MPRDILAMKDGVGHERVRRAAKQALTRTCPNGATRWIEISIILKPSKVGLGSEPGELKHLSTLRNINQVRDSPSSGERTGKSLNLLKQFNRGCGTAIYELQDNRTSWEARP